MPSRLLRASFSSMCIIDEFLWRNWLSHSRALFNYTLTSIITGWTQMCIVIPLQLFVLGTTFISLVINIADGQEIGTRIVAFPV
jgi:hypothetical protein